MKKIFFVFSLFSLFFLFLIPQKALAVCIGNTTSSSCPSNASTPCFVSGYLYENFCCDSSISCTNYGTGGVVATPKPPSGKANTTNTNNASGTDLTKCDNGKAGIQTAIGCIPVFNQTDFLSAILKWAVGIGGGIAFLLIVYAGFMIMTASGNPERLKAGQELLTSALSGLILLVLSIFVLKFIGVDILGLGQFGFGAAPTP